MNTRICSVIAVVMVMTLSSGCCGMRNFLFGRGARCGLCNRTENVIPAPQYADPMQVPCCPPQPTCQAPPPPDGCGCQGYVDESIRGPIYTGRPCGTCGSQYAGECGCGGAVDSYGPAAVDPYTSGPIVGGATPYDGQIMGERVIGGQPAPPPPPPIQADDFRARKFDTDGNRILWEEPLPQGATSL